MSFDFTVKEFILGNGTGTPTLQFYKRGFELNGGGVSPSWQDIILSGNTALTLTNALADGLNYLKLFGGTEQRNLPSGYTQVEYLESSNTQWINTGYYPNANTKFEISGTQGNTDSALFGLSVVFYCFNNSGSTTFYGFCGDAGSFNFTMGSVPVVLTMSATDGIVINGTKYIDLTASSTTADYPMALFGRMNNSTGEVAKLGYHRINYAKVYENNILIHNYIPCRRNSDNVLGMYDTVSKTFLTNQGTGDFTAGADVTTPSPDTPMDIVCNNGVVKVRHQSGLPLGYQAVEYIESSGTQYIDTGVARGSSDFVAEYDMNMVTANGARFAFAGANWNVSSYLAFDTSDNTFDVGQGITDHVQGALNTRYKLKAEYKVGSIVLSLYDNNGTLLASTTRTNNSWVSSNTDSWLFGTVRDIPSSASFSYTLKSFGGKIWQGTTLVRNLIPCRRNSDNVIGMYDLVNNTFLPNAGTGNFTAGTDVDAIEIYTDGTVETVQVTGKNLFDKNDIAYNNSTILADGSIISAENIYVLDYIPVQPNTIYTYSSTTNSARAYNKRIVCFDANKNYITSIADTTGNPSGQFSITGTTPANTKYVRVACSNDQMATAQLEQGSTATSYEPYFNGGTATAEMLLKIGTYQDVQEVIAGGVTRNVGIKVLDGTEDWTAYNGGVYFPLGGGGSLPATTVAYCSHFSYAGSDALIANLPMGGFTIATNGNCSFKSSDTATKADWRAYLASQYANGTPVIIVYPKSSATTETVTGQPLTIQEGTNIVEITQSAIDNLGLEVSYKATV